MVKRKNGSYVYKEYVLTPCKNIENNKISWWISKKRYVIAIYAFSTNGWCNDALKEAFEREIKNYITVYENYLKRLTNAK